jgi:3-hydroxymyristoyl/3-hydroxydecanoyl-(acyl carrier protein) dehydratase
MKISSSHPAIAGHFPGRPVVPGVVLLEIVLEALAAQAGRALRVTGLPAVKFLAPLAPEEEFTLDLHWREAGRADFDVLAQGRRVLTGSVRYDDRDGGEVA